MPAYAIADIKIEDLETYKGYQALTPATIEKYGGRFKVRGGDSEVKEGQWQPGRIVVLEFDDLNALKRWYDSPEYTEARAIRQKAATGSIVFVEGV